jgi:hypothetical protein
VAISYEAASERLEQLWDYGDGADAPLPSELDSAIETVLKGRDRSPRWALLTQLLFKVQEPSIDSRRLEKQQGLPSARVFAQKTTVPFDQSHGAALGGKGDP